MFGVRILVRKVKGRLPFLKLENENCRKGWGNVCISIKIIPGNCYQIILYVELELNHHKLSRIGRVSFYFTTFPSPKFPPVKGNRMQMSVIRYNCILKMFTVHCWSVSPSIWSVPSIASDACSQCHFTLLLHKNRELPYHSPGGLWVVTRKWSWQPFTFVPDSNVPSDGIFEQSQWGQFLNYNLKVVAVLSLLLNIM